LIAVVTHLVRHVVNNVIAAGFIRPAISTAPVAVLLIAVITDFTQALVPFVISTSSGLTGSLRLAAGTLCVS